MPTVPLTRCVTARWSRPRYELLDARGSVLAALSEISPIAGFQPSHDAVFVEFVNGLQLDVGLGAVTAISVGHADPTIYRPQIQAVAKTLGSSKVWVDFALQHLIAWVDQEDSATAQTMAAVTVSGVETAIDCASVIDGLISGWQYKAEFGVVDASEIPDRVARRVGRASGPRIDADIANGEFSQVSTFIDSHWKATEPWDVNLDEGWSVANAVDELASRLAIDLHNHLTLGVEGQLRDGA